MTDTLTALLLFFLVVVWMRLWLDRAKKRGGTAEDAADARQPGPRAGGGKDRERWGRIDLRKLHPLNRDEVLRLLEMADADGVGELSSRDRVFLDNMALPRSRS
jgi:hypothetical protein